MCYFHCLGAKKLPFQLKNSRVSQQVFDGKTRLPVGLEFFPGLVKGTQKKPQLPFAPTHSKLQEEDQHERQDECQGECQNECQNQLQNVCQVECQNVFHDERQNVLHFFCTDLFVPPTQPPWNS